ncbi:MAG: molybdopterin-dependent oxidoreductase [Candidatus Sumerlaeia bacterium]|nr:molybdopterin-dependent oxidoreductase [Candidatus Sumerlaeia bacterium]
MDRRGFIQLLGAGILVTVFEGIADAQRSSRSGGGSGGGRGRNVSARIHIGEDGVITVMTGKIEMGQGARAELTQSAAEELHVPPDSIRMVMGDTHLCPDDGTTAGSRTTPSTVPAVRQAAAAARMLLIGLACKQWGVAENSVEVRDGVITHPPSNRTVTFAELAKSGAAAKALDQPAPPGVSVTPVKEWKVMGTSYARPNRRDLVTGAHKFPSDLILPNMLHGKVLRPPSYGAKLLSIDLEPAKAMKDVVVLREGDFVGVAAPTTFQATQALKAIAETAKWESAPHPSSTEVYDYLRQRVRSKRDLENPFANEMGKAAKVLKQTYRTAYIQHAPAETRTALAEWKDGHLTVWTCTQAPFGYHSELGRAFQLPSERVRVIVPDFGCGFGGKHTAESAIEAARLARAAGRPVSVKWTREEEFTWAYFRPAAVIEIEAGLDEKGQIAVWHFININSGAAAVQTPYRIAHNNCRYVPSDTPLRQGSYRTLAATANNFARECMMDELAAAAGADPLDFRLAHLDNDRIRAVLEEAARQFDWRGRRKQKRAPGTGIGLACGTEKASVVAACVEISVDEAKNEIVVKKVTEVFEAGTVVNPENLRKQVIGCILMGLGGALREEMIFEGGKMLNASFGKYLVPRFKDVPELDIHLRNWPGMEPVGGGETPIIAIAPAIANAVFDATGRRIRQMPIKLSAAKPGQTT